MNENFLLGTVQQHLGEDAVVYLKNKNRGGQSNEKGSSYEAAFAVFKLAEGLNDYLETQAKCEIQSQNLAFVDDLTVISGSSKLAYQLKNSSNVSWGGGKHPIALDFKHQVVLDRALGFNVDTWLVISDKDKAAQLNNEVPDEIQQHAGCEYFPSFPINRTFQEKPAVRKVFQELCALSTSDKLVHLHTAILGVWMQYKNSLVCISEFEKELRKIMPSYLKSAKIHPEAELGAELHGILAAIPNFTFKILSGFLVYEYQNAGCVMSGTLESSIGTPEFSAFERAVLTERPQSFSALLDLELL